MRHNGQTHRFCSEICFDALRKRVHRKSYCGTTNAGRLLYRIRNVRSTIGGVKPNRLFATDKDLSVAKTK
ncbi:MAG: hypothetical protein ACI4QL_00940 [Candidatus Fimimonas sp.]